MPMTKIGCSICSRGFPDSGGPSRHLDPVAQRLGELLLHCGQRFGAQAGLGIDAADQHFEVGAERGESGWDIGHGDRIGDHASMLILPCGVPL